jgi:hypothetical protein
MNSALNSLPLRHVPTASSLAAAVNPGLALRAGRAIWRALERAGEARPRRHILDLAERCEAHQPELAKELRASVCHGPMV